MKKEAFVKVIEAIEAQIDRGERLGEAIKQAYLDAGEEEDFRDGYSYIPATNIMEQELVDALALEMSNKNYPVEYSKDLINWYLYDILTHKKLFDENLTDYAYYEDITSGCGRTYVRNASELYDALVKEMTRSLND